MYTQNSYEDQDRLVSSYTQYGNYTYKAPVTEMNPLYLQGTILDMGNPAYFFAISPNVDVLFTYNINATESADLIIDSEPILIATSTDGSGGEKKIVWRKEFPIGDRKIASIKNKEKYTQTFSVNVPEIQSKVTEIQDKLKYSPNTTIEINNHINYKGKINGQDVKNSTDFPIKVLINPPYYQMPEKLEFSEVNDTYSKSRIKKENDLFAMKLPLSLFLASTIIIGMMFPCMRMKKVDQDYIDKLEKQRDSLPFKEFVSKGVLPENTTLLIKVEITSLQELIDAAIDMSERVIYDPKSNVYFTIHNNVLYIYFDK